MKRLLVLACTIVLAGCSATASREAVSRESTSAHASSRQMTGDLPPIEATEDVRQAEVRRPITGTCGMEGLQHYVGQPRTSVPASAIPGTYRVLGPDSVTMMEHRPDRVTIRVDARDVVESIACG